MASIALICNPGSGKGLAPEEVAARLRLLGARVVVTVAFPEELPPELTVDRLVVVSGDGTLGRAAACAAQRGIPLAVIAGGTANDFARSLGLPLEAGPAAELAATGATLRSVELGRMDGRPFLNAASVGLSPAAGRRAAPLKSLLGPLAYSVGGVLAGLLEKPVELTARVDGRAVFEGRAWQATVACTGAFGGGAEIEEADPHDGDLDLVVVPAGSRLRLPRRALAMRRGTLASQAGVVHLEGATVELDLTPGTPLNVDGELVAAERATVRFSATRAAFRLVVG